jgi:transposase
LDVHAETIAVAAAEPGGEVHSLGTIPNRPEPVARLIRKLGKPEQLRVCYEAGPTGYVLYWQLSELGVQCEVIAPTLVPEKAGDRVKTDRRDAEKLARCYRAGDLTPVWVPDAAHEALRDLVRARLAAKRDQLRARNRLSKFLLRHGRRAPAGTTAWTLKYLAWVKQQSFEHAAPPAPDRGRGGLGLPAPPGPGRHLARSATRSERGHQGDRLEGPTPPARPLREGIKTCIERGFMVMMTNSGDSGI